MAVSNYIEAVEIIRRLEGGITRPFLCRANNDKHYVVKGLELPPAERIAELLCARLAAQFGLPIPEHGCIYVDPALLRYNPEARSDLGPGDSYALAYVADAADLLYSQALQVPSSLQKAVFVFDYWVGNSDRQLGPFGGRPNLLMCSTNNQLQLIDHNQAFQCHWMLQGLLKAMCSAPKIGNGVWIWSTKLNTLSGCMTLLDDFVAYAQTFPKSGVSPLEHSDWKRCLRKLNAA